MWLTKRNQGNQEPETLVKVGGPHIILLTSHSDIVVILFISSSTYMTRINKFQRK